MKRKKRRIRNNRTVRSAVLVIALFAALAAGSMISERQEAGEEVEEGIARGNTEDDILEETFIAETEEGEKLEIPVTVYPRELLDEEKEEYLDLAVEEFEESYLGENASAEEVCLELDLRSSYADGMVEAVFESDEPSILWEDGSLSLENLDEEGQMVTLTGTFSCQEATLSHSVSVRIVSESSAESASLESELAEAVEEAEASSRTSARFKLPDSFSGGSVTWKKQMDLQPLVLIMVGVAAGICLLQRPVQRKKDEKKKEEKELREEYPLMVMEISLLMGAGMTAVTAWERMVKRYQQRREAEGEKAKKLYMEEMLITYREMKDGCGTRRAWEQFGNRIGLVPYRKFSSLLVQNMDKGTRDTAALLNQEAELVLEEQKNSAKKLGEEAGTKLLVPMIMLLLLVLLLIMIPAMMSF